MMEEQSSTHRRLIVLFHLGCLIILLVCILIERRTDSQAIYADHIGEVRDAAEVRSELLMEAMQYVGSCEPLSAVQTWITGLMQRSGAIQYAVLSSALKVRYATCLTEQRPNWVTGESSPWVSGYRLISDKMLSNSEYEYTIQITTKTSAGPWGQYQAVLHVIYEEGFWRIDNITSDSEFVIYMGCDLNKASSQNE